MRLMAFFVLLFSASSAIAATRPGPPPWSCMAIEACNVENICAPLSGMPLGFNLRNFKKETNKFAFEGYNGAERIVLLFSNLEDAQRYVETDSSETGVSVILIRNNLMADTHSFWAHSVFVRGTGQRIVSKDKMLVACDSIRKS